MPKSTVIRIGQTNMKNMPPLLRGMRRRSFNASAMICLHGLVSEAAAGQAQEHLFERRPLHLERFDRCCRGDAIELGQRIRRLQRAAPGRRS